MEISNLHEYFGILSTWINELMIEVAVTTQNSPPNFQIEPNFLYQQCMKEWIRCTKLESIKCISGSLSRVKRGEAMTFLGEPWENPYLDGFSRHKKISAYFWTNSTEEDLQDGSFHRMCKEHVCACIAIHGNIFSGMNVISGGSKISKRKKVGWSYDIRGVFRLLPPQLTTFSSWHEFLIIRSL